MKKIPTLFKRNYINHCVVETLNEVTEGMEWVLNGEGIATVKIDGSCCAVIGGIFYRRYDAKRGKVPPPNVIPCCPPDPITGHWPHWLKVNFYISADKWYAEAYKRQAPLSDGTYEIIGPHFQNNPYHLTEDVLVKHGQEVIEVPRTFEGIRDYLSKNYIEGIVFWKNGEPQCKIKRTDFGLSWPVK